MKRTLNLALILVSFMLWTNQANAYTFIGDALDSMTIGTDGPTTVGYTGTFGVQSDYGSTSTVDLEMAVKIELTGVGEIGDDSWSLATARWSTNAPGEVSPSWLLLNDDYEYYYNSNDYDGIAIRNLLFTFDLTPGTLYEWHMEVDVETGTTGGRATPG